MADSVPQPSSFGAQTQPSVEPPKSASIEFRKNVRLSVCPPAHPTGRFFARRPSAKQKAHACRVLAVRGPSIVGSGFGGRPLGCPARRWHARHPSFNHDAGRLLSLRAYYIAPCDRRSVSGAASCGLVRGVS
jgi:hypothetical protein